jgi:hypothetical protein
VQQRQVLGELGQNLRCALHGGAGGAAQFVLAFAAPGAHAVLRDFQVALERPVAAMHKALVQAERAVHAARGALGQLERVVVPVEQRDPGRQLHQVLRLARDPYVAPADVGAGIAPHPRTHGACQHLCAKAVAQHGHIVRQRVLQQAALLFDPAQLFVGTVVAAQHHHPR